MPTVPAKADDLTPDFFSEVLRTDVTDVQVLDNAFATNQRARVGLTYGDSEAGPATLFVKLAPLDPAHKAMIDATGMGVREVQFFKDASSHVGLRVPRCHWGGWSDDGSFALVLEDLAARGCQFTDGWGVSADAAAEALERLAAFHARFESQAIRDDVAPWLRNVRERPAGATAERLRYVLDEHADKLTEAYIAVGNLYVEHHERIDALWDGGPQTMIHGDPHIGNVYLDDGHVGFLDWGLCRVSTHLRDISYFLTMTVDPEERRANERDLLKLYIGAVKANGGADIAFNEAWANHRVQGAYTVVATFLAFMPSYASGDGVTLGADLRRRSELALEDLEVEKAVREAVA